MRWISVRCSLGGVLVCLIGPGAASSAPADPAPIASDVIEALVHAPLRRHAHRTPERLHRQLDALVVLLTRIDDEERGATGSDRRPPRPTDAHMLLGSALHELGVVRAELRAVSVTVGARLAGAGQSVAEWDERWARIEERFDRVSRELGDLHRSRTRGDRLRALRVARATLRALHETVDRGVARSSNIPGPTLIQAQPTFQRPDPTPAPPPQYMSSHRHPRALYAFLGQTLLAAAPPTLPEAQRCGYTPADLGQSQEVQLTSEIQALAESLAYSPVKLYQHVANEIAFEPYYGSLKGAIGTLYSKAGNATDQASLLIALLRASNIPARYVKGTASFSNDPRLLRWVGAQDYLAAAHILALGRIPTAFASPGVVQFTHVWVEACVPYGNYRGTGIDPSGHRWIPLDPSFKDKTYQTGIATNVEFDYTGYMARRSNDLPHEKYAQQVEAFIKTQSPNYANNTLDDVGYIGRVVPRPVDILPASLPYEIITFTGWGSSGSAETAEVPDGHRYKLEIVPEDGATPEHDLANLSSFSDWVVNVPAVIVSLPDVVLKRVTLSFKGATAGDQSALDAWKNDPNQSAPLPCTVTVVPSIRVDGVEQPLSGPSMGLCTTTNRLTLRFVNAEISEISIAGRPFSPVSSGVHTIQAADYHAVLGYAFQTSDRLLTERAARLLASVSSTSNPNSNQDETEGEFLHVAGLKYLRYLANGIRRIGELDGGSGQSGHHLGLTSSRMKVTYAFDQPFAVYRAGYLVDMVAPCRNVDLVSGSPVWKSFRLMGYMASAYESYVWQENARLDAVSSVRGIQFARETGIEVLAVASANWPAEKPKLTSNADPAYNYSSIEVAKVESLVNAGYTVTLPRRLLQYQNWKGSVWIYEKNDPFAEMGFIISGSYAGGQTVSAPLSFGFDPTLDIGWLLEGLPPTTTAPPIGINSANTQGATRYSLWGGDPVNLVTGSMYHTERDLAIRGRGGLPIVFERSYNSRSAVDGPLGFGWTHSFNHVLVFTDDNANGVDDAADHDGLTSSVTWVDGTGSQKFIRVSGTAGGVAPGSVFTSPSGFFFQVTRNADGTYTIREKNGLTYTFESVAGTTSQRAKLLRITDRNGNALTLTYAGALLSLVTDGLNRSLTVTYDTNNRITEVRDWTNRQHQYVYDASGNLVTYKNPLAVAGLQNPVTYTYYSDPQLSHAMRTYTLPRGNGMTFEYYANGRVFRHYNTLGHTMTFTYNDFRRETVTVNERGHIRRVFFDPNANPIKVVGENGGERTYTYDPANPMNRLTNRDPMGRTTSYAYDTNGNVTRITLPSGNTVEYSFFNTFNQPQKIKDARGNYTILKYDGGGNLLETIRLTSGLGATVDPTTYTPAAGDVVAWTINTYDAFGNVLTMKQVRDPAAQAGPTVEYDYHDTVNGVVGLNAARITRRGDKNGDGAIAADEVDTASLSYDALGRATTGLRPDWYATQAVYDAVDRILRGTDAVGQLRDYTYDPNGNLVRESLTVGMTLVDDRTATFDLADRRIAQADAGGFVTNYQYDAAGNPVAVTNPDGRTLGFEYDPANRVVSSIDPEGHRVSRTLDLDGQPRTITDPNGGTVTFSYYGPERDGRLKSQTDPLGRVTQIDYDAHGNVISVTDNLGRATLTSYDELDHPVRVVGPAYTDVTLGLIRPVRRYTYNLLGHLTTVEAGRTDATGTNPASDAVTTQMVYLRDDFGRKLRETDPLGRSWAFSYDVHGNPVTVTDPRGPVIRASWGYGHQLLSKTDDTGTLTYAGYTRNALGQVTQAQSPAVTYSYTYDSAHRLASVTDSRGGKQIMYSYSPGGLLNSMQTNDDQRTDYVYDPVGRLAGIWAPNGEHVAFAYDAGGRLTEKWRRPNFDDEGPVPNGVNTHYLYDRDNTLRWIQSDRHTHHYRYDAVGNREIVVQNTWIRYVYDQLDRLVEVRNYNTGALLESYTYDILGNRTSKTAGGNTLAYVYDAANQLTEIRQDSVSGSVIATLGYDANGNLTNKIETAGPTTALTYDGLNRLVEVTKTGQNTETYTYGSAA